MRKEKENKNKRKISASFLIFNMILGIAAFVFIISGFGVVSGANGDMFLSKSNGLTYKINNDKVELYNPSTKAWQSSEFTPTEMSNTKIFNKIEGVASPPSGLPITGSGRILGTGESFVAQQKLAKPVNFGDPSTPEKAFSTDQTYIRNGESYIQNPTTKEYIKLTDADKAMIKNNGALPKDASGNPIDSVDKLPVTEEAAKAAADAAALKAANDPTASSPLGPISWSSSASVNYLVSGVLYAAAAYGAIQLIGTLLGLKSTTTNAASAAIAGGIILGRTAVGVVIDAAKGTTWATQNSGILGMTNAGAIGLGIGIAAAIIIFLCLYEEESQSVVTFNCYPWQAPIGGKDCEKCNSDLLGCTEYRCKSLGQACVIANKGTKEERCINDRYDDVSAPVISVWTEPLTKGYKYNPNDAVNPPDVGFKVENSQASDKCLKAFSPLTFGITTNEPAQCKLDYNRTLKYDDMQFYFGASTIFGYNHTQTLSLPGPDQLTSNGPLLRSDGKYNLYIRCKDAHGIESGGKGNSNDGLFVISFCVEKGPDVTPPKIEGTSINNNMPIQYGLNETKIELYVNEPADCKWSKVDMEYDEMENSMSCSQNIWEMNNQMLYKCSGTLNGLQDRADNIFYFRCKDQPWLGTSGDRMKNTESYKFTLKGSQPLNIIDANPNGTIMGAGNVVPIYLQATTDNGFKQGDATCYYSLTQSEKDYTQMFETGTNKHKQRLDLPPGSYTYYLQCVDLGGNADTRTVSFTIEVDRTAPIVTRVYQESTRLKIVTNEKSICSFSQNEERKCNFLISEGTSMPLLNSTDHYADWTTKNYYIKCSDANNNQPLPTECSIIVKPRNNQI